MPPALTLTYNGTGAEWDRDTVGRKGTEMGTQWDWGTLGRGHSGTEGDGEGDTMGLGHNGTGEQWDGDTVGRKGTEKGTQWDWGTTGRGHNGTGAQWDGRGRRWGHKGTGAQWDGDTVERKRTGVGHNGTGAQQDGGTIVGWLVSCCFEPSQPQRITSGLRGTMERGTKGHSGMEGNGDGDTLGPGHNGTGAL